MLPRKLKNFVLFNDGTSYLGEVEEVMPPTLTRKTEAYRASGMSGPVKLDFGMEGLLLEWNTAGYLRSLLAQWSQRAHGRAAALCQRAAVGRRQRSRRR